MVFGLRRRKEYLEEYPGSLEEFKQQQETQVKASKIVREAREKLIKREKKEREERAKGFRRTGFELGKSIREFGRTQPEDLSSQQEVMKGLFGGGEKIWGWKGEPVELNHDLNPRRRGDRGTAELFGLD